MSIPPSRCSPTLETGASNGERASRGKLSPKYFNLSESYFALPTPPDNSDTAPPTKSSPRTTNLPLAIIPSPTSPTGFPRSPPPPLDPARRAVDPARLPLSPSTFPPLSAPSTANSASPRTDVISLFPPLQSNPPRRLADSTRLPLSPSTFSSLSATTSPRKSLSPLASAPGSIRATPSNRFTVFTPTTLVQKLLSPDSSSSKLDSILILDIRTHTAYLHRRLKSSLNICVPSTLLRRPAYGIDRVAEGLSAPERTKLSRWSTATTIIVVDLDSSSLVDGGGITSLLAKFERGGFAGTLGWVKGGFTAISEAAKSTPEGRTLLERGPVEHTPSTTTSTTSKPHLTLPPSRSNRPVLQVRDLPIAAFQQASTATFVHAGLPSATSSLGSSHSSHPPGAIDARTGARMGLGKRRSSGMEGLTLNLIPPMAAEKGLVHLPLTTTPAGETRMASNPFFDNIRQNNEVSSIILDFLSRRLTFVEGTLVDSILGESLSDRRAHPHTNFPRSPSEISLLLHRPRLDGTSFPPRSTILRSRSSGTGTTRRNDELACQRPRQGIRRRGERRRIQKVWDFCWSRIGECESLQEHLPSTSSLLLYTTATDDECVV